MMIKKVSLVALSCLLLATGCSKVQERALETVDNQLKEADKNLENLREERTDEKNIGAVRHADRVWLGSRGYRQQNGDPLPNKYDNITYISAQPQSLSEIASDISSMTGMRLVVRDADVSESSSSDSSMDISGGGNSSSGAIALSYTGDFVGLLNQLSTKFDIFWEHKENVIYLSKYVTRTLALYALPSTTTLSAEITSESDSSEVSVSDEEGGDSSSSGTDNTVNLETSINVWEEIAEVIESMIPDGSKYAMSPSTGTLTITSSPLAIRKVENLIKKQNEIISRQVVIDVNVMSIITTETEKFNVEFTSVLKNISDNFGGSFSGPTGNLEEISGLGNFDMGYISDSGENTVNLILDQLSEKFDRSAVTNATVTTLNNHTVPLQIITREAYLKSIEQSVEDGIITTAATPADITTGFVMNVLPRVLANGNIMLQYSMSISERTGLDVARFGEDSDGDGVQDSYIQLPTVVSRDFLQNLRLKSGNTLILSGYDRIYNDSQKSGSGTPDNYLLGGGKYGTVNKEVLVIMITPRIIE